MKILFKILNSTLIVILLLNIPFFSDLSVNAKNPTPLPPSFSWRNIDGVDYVPPIKDQSPAPTCETYALCAALETIIQYQIGYPFGCDLSEIHLFFQSGGTCDWGVHITNATEYLVNIGVPDEGCCPDPHRPYDAVYESLPGWEERTVKISNWGWVPDDVDSIKQALITYGPLSACILVRRDFTNYRGGIYRSGPWEVTAGHVVTIVGYDDTNQCWLIRNSWGETWGEDGYIRVAYDTHTENRPFFYPFYGGTGILYIEGVYGNLMPDVPRINIDCPQIFHTYIFGVEIPTVLRRLNIFQRAAPRIIGNQRILVDASNTEVVEFYLDGTLIHTDEEAPFGCMISATRGLHTFEIYASNGEALSKAMLDGFFLI